MTFKIHTHGRLQEWIADAKGYFTDAGLTDYAMSQVALPRSTQAAPAGAYQSYEQGRDASISCACHWTVNMAASNAHGKLWRDAYSVSPCGIFVARDSGIASLRDLADVAVDVGYQSGSHYATIQALEKAVDPAQVRLNFAGSPDQRLARLVAGESKAATLFGIQLYAAEQLGFRKIADTTFMIVGLIPDGVDPDDVRKYYTALKRAQQDIDLNHQDYAHYYLNELPAEYHDRMDVAAFGPGERIVFEPYSAEMYEKTHDWVEDRAIFAADKVGRAAYQEAVLAPPDAPEAAFAHIIMGSSDDRQAQRGAFMDRHIGHLLRRAYVRARKDSADALLEIGDLSPIQASALAALMDGALSQAELGRRIEMEPANTHTLVRRLIAAGHVSRYLDEGDRRLARIALTPGGVAIAERLESTLQQSSRRTMSVLDENERRQLIESLRKIVDAKAG